MTEAEQQTRRWLQECVLALGLCPFAGPVLRDASLRIAVSTAQGLQAELQDFVSELELLQHATEQDVSTTLLVFDHGLSDFMTFLERLEQCQQLLEQAGLEGTIQLASFHPHYLFAQEPVQALSHFTNRSPWPTIHLLRESMMTSAIARHPDPQQIPADNIALLTDMGREQVLALWRSCGVESDPD